MSRDESPQRRKNLSEQIEDWFKGYGRVPRFKNPYPNAYRISDDGRIVWSRWQSWFDGWREEHYPNRPVSWQLVMLFLECYLNCSQRQAPIVKPDFPSLDEQMKEWFKDFDHVPRFVNVDNYPCRNEGKIVWAEWESAMVEYLRVNFPKQWKAKKWSWQAVLLFLAEDEAVGTLAGQY